MKNALMILLTAVLSFGAWAQPGRNISEYNLSSSGMGLIDGSNPSTAKAFDPVSVFSEGGGNTLLGKAEFALTHKGVEYLFGNGENMKQFVTNPEKYEPTYGGYCARAMVVGQKVHIDTSLFTIVGNRSFFFVNSRAKRFFDREIEKNAALADQKWKEISGESPRL